MKVEELATAVVDACEAKGVEHMLTGAFATSVYGIPRSTKDVGKTPRGYRALLAHGEGGTLRVVR